MNFVIVLIVVFMLESERGEAKCPSDKCECRADQIRCSGFDSFDELDFPLERTQVNILELKPSRSLQVNGQLKLNGLRVARQVILHNIKGFSMQDNPFSKIIPESVADQTAKTGVGIELALFDSEFEFYEAANTRLDAMCTSGHLSSTDLFDNSVISKFSKLSFNGNIVYPKNMCPFVFKNAKIDLILAYFMNSTNRFDFRQFTDVNDIGAKINSFYLFSSNLGVLSERVLNRNVFGSLKTFHYEGKLELIESNLLSEMRALKSIKLELTNFRQFIMSENKTEWMLDLNEYEDLASTIKYMHKAILMLYLTDKTQEFEYTDDDFCLFKNFPSNRFVYPIIKSRPALLCSCTVMWLIKNYKAYLTPQLLTMLKTNSISHCLDIEKDEFNKHLDQCRFDDRLFRCDRQRFTTTKHNPMMSSVDHFISSTRQNHVVMSTSNSGSNVDMRGSTEDGDVKAVTEVFQNENQKAAVRALAVFIATVGFISISAILGFVLFLYR